MPGTDSEKWTNDEPKTIHGQTGGRKKTIINWDVSTIEDIKPVIETGKGADPVFDRK